MRVELLVDRAGPMGVQSAGDRIDVPDDEARRMIEAGQAAPVRAVAPERAVRQPRAERAARGA